MPDIIVLFVFVIILVPIGTLSYIAAFNKARRDGTLSKYRTNHM